MGSAVGSASSTKKIGVQGDLADRLARQAHKVDNDQAGKGALANLEGIRSLAETRGVQSDFAAKPARQANKADGGTGEVKNAPPKPAEPVDDEKEKKEAERKKKAEEAQKRMEESK